MALRAGLLLYAAAGLSVRVAAQTVIVYASIVALAIQAAGILQAARTARPA